MTKVPSVGILVFADNGSCSMYLVEHFLGDLNYLEIAEGVFKKDCIPENVKIFVEGKPCDYVGNPLSWHICSNRLAKHLETHASACVRLIDIPLYYKSGARIDGYSLAIPTKNVDCLNYDKSEFLDGQGGPTCMEPVIKRSSVKDLPPLFLVEGCPWTVLFSQGLIASLVGKGFTGIGFLECEVS
ncbi:hypothetical protein [Microbulbifer sp. JTAC008]|uniref:hypothetical protein n=1 Tax=Microbulbifer sp. JTAC008 TaxID=3243374 RepID=UPI004038FB78